MLPLQRNAPTGAVCGEPRGLAPAGSPTPEMVAGSLNQATAKPYHHIETQLLCQLLAPPGGG